MKGSASANPNAKEMCGCGEASASEIDVKCPLPGGEGRVFIYRHWFRFVRMLGELAQFRFKIPPHRNHPRAREPQLSCALAPASRLSWSVNTVTLKQPALVHGSGALLKRCLPRP